MPDHDPSEASDERSMLHELLRAQRSAIVKKVGGISDEGARSSPVPSGTSLLWLVRHLTYAEAIWVLDRFAGLGHAVVPANRTESGDTIKAAVRDYRAMGKRVDAVIEGASLDDVCRAHDRTPPMDLRRVLGHLVAETARHAGHADIIRELHDGRTGR